MFFRWKSISITYIDEDSDQNVRRQAILIHFTDNISNCYVVYVLHIFKSDWFFYNNKLITIDEP